MNPAVTGLFKGNAHNFWGDRCDFNIHLQRCHTRVRTSHFKIHIAKMVFVTKNVRQDGKIIAVLDQTHGNTGNGPLYRHASIHQGQRTATYGRH